MKWMSVGIAVLFIRYTAQWHDQPIVWGGAGPVKESTWIAQMTALPSFATISDETEPLGVSDHDDDTVSVIVVAVSTRF